MDLIVFVTKSLRKTKTSNKNNVSSLSRKMFGLNKKKLFDSRYIDDMLYINRKGIIQKNKIVSEQTIIHIMTVLIVLTLNFHNVKYR